MGSPLYGGNCTRAPVNTAACLDNKHLTHISYKAALLLGRVLHAVQVWNIECLYCMNENTATEL